MKIAIFRALQLGDLLCAIPAVRAIRGAYPEARIALVGLAWARELAMRFAAYFDGFLEFPGFPGMPERRPDMAAIPRFFDAAAEQRFDLVLQMHGSGELSNPIAVLMGGTLSAGFYRAGHYRPDPQRFFEWRDDEHEVRRWLRLVRSLGIEPRGEALEFPLASRDWADWRSLRLGDYAVLHPGSQLASRRWPAERFGEVGDALAAEGLQIVLTGTAGEANLTQRISFEMREPAIDLAGRTTLGSLAAVIARARLLVCNDTGVSHIAAATRTPSVVVACGSDPGRWAPLDRELHRVLYFPISCRPCAHRECPIGHPCALAVSPQAVIQEARKALLCAA
ncbi:MAG TPA: glycosyltransferase family 9 protein [Burkholderiales bacterium]|jgi:ADP-heptose:LPS heptosyltransferase|nr:glycosyltransferase family 9 protein [Burkholderiales bacterium]